MKHLSSRRIYPSVPGRWAGALFALVALLACAPQPKPAQHWATFVKEAPESEPPKPAYDPQEIILPLDVPSYTLYFDFDSDELKDSLKAMGVVAYIQATNRLVHIVGHASPEGSANYNMALSFLRAAALRDFLLEKGIPLHQIELEAEGETKPVSLTDFPLDRRVEVTFEGDVL